MSAKAGGQIAVRAVTAEDRLAWEKLFRGYRDFYNKQHDPAVFDTVWEWLHNPKHECRCLLAWQGETAIGLAHYRTFARPITGTTAIYLDDLFTAPESRGSGAGRALITEIQRIAAAENASMVRWITAADNHTARHLYDQLAQAGNWVTYDTEPRFD